VEITPSSSRGALLAPEPGVRALRDGDFPDDLANWTPVPTARRWEVDGVARGWVWRRKELENYLLDAEVLTRTFRWSDADRARYDALLAELCAATWERTAARMALVDLLHRFERPVVKPFDPALRGDTLEAALRDRHRRAVGPTRFDADTLVARFRAFRALCAPGGPGHSPWVIAGKDLLGAISRAPDIRARFPDLVVPERLTAAVLGALAADPAPHTWLPEWVSLRADVRDWLDGGVSSA
jgi:hypothetical protein